MTNPDLVKYIKDTQKQGFEMRDVKQALEKRGWPGSEIHDAINEAISPRGTMKHHHRKHSHKMGLAIALTVTFAACYVLAVLLKPLNHLVPALANPLGEYLFAPLILALIVIAITMILAIVMRKAAGVL